MDLGGFKHLRLDLSAMAGSALPRQVGQGAVAGSLVLAVLVIVSFERPQLRCPWPKLTLILGGLCGDGG